MLKEIENAGQPALETGAHPLYVLLHILLAVGTTAAAFKVKFLLFWGLAACAHFSLMPASMVDGVWDATQTMFFSKPWAVPLLGFAVMAVHGRAVLLLTTTRYTLTMEHLLVARGLLLRKREILELRRIRDVRGWRPFYIAFFGAGTIDVYSIDSLEPHIRMRHISGYARFLEELMLSVRRESRVTQFGTAAA